jgi:predicted permease
MSRVIQDLRYALRRLRNEPGFAFVCVVTLALGIGANTAIFTLVNAVMLKSLPVTRPGELYRLGNVDTCCVIGGLQGEWGIYSEELYRQFRDHSPEFSEMAAFQGGHMTLSVRRGSALGPAEPYAGEFVSGNYFAMFGITAFAGLTITPADDQPGASPIAVMSYRAWQMRFGLDPAVIGSTFTIDKVPYTIAGIAPPGFFGDQLRPDPPDFWLPLATEPSSAGPGSLLNRGDQHWLYIIGRLRPGASPGGVQSEVTVQLQQWLRTGSSLTAQDRENIDKQHITLAPAGGGVANMQYETAAGLRLLMIISGLVLLIACANVANLLLARGSSHRLQTAIHIALGAPRTRLIGRSLTESVLMAILGGVAGLLFAYGGARAILVLAFRGARYVPISPAPSLTVLGFAFLLSLATGVIFGVAPAWIASRSDPAEALRGAGRSTRDRSSIPQRLLVMLQVAVSAVLLIGAGLLTESLRHLQDQRFGFQTDGRLMVSVDLNSSQDKLFALYDRLQSDLERIPGVLSASFALYSPMEGNNWSTGIQIEGHAPDERTGASWDRIGPHYFETVGSRLLRGRTITNEDTPTSRHVAVINQTFATKFFPDSDPIGKHLGFMGDPGHRYDFEIVGIVEDAKYQDARSPAYATLFLPMLQTVRYSDPSAEQTQFRSTHIGTIAVRAAGQPERLEPEVRRVLDDIDPDLTVLNIQTFDEQLSLNFNQDRLIARLTELFGVLALILACVGLYGLTAYSVARRTSEIGIRMALGANRNNVLGLVLRGALVQTLVGLTAGILAALGAGRLLASQLYGVKSYDAVIMGTAAAVLAGCALMAALLPARRAASIEPTQALRTE